MIIVGAGPVGLTLALALARQEVPSVVLDEGPGKDEPRPARTVVLREDTAALLERLTGVPLAKAGAHWAGWRSMRRKQVMREITFDDTEPAPLHIAQHVLTGALRQALAGERLVKLAVDSRLDAIEQEPSGVTAHTPRPQGHLVARQLHLVGCDGPRSTVRKLLDIRFPGRTAVERHAAGRAAHGTSVARPGVVAPGAAVADVRTLGRGGHRTPLPDGVWRLDWLLPPGKDLVTPELLLTRIRETLAGWTEGPTPPYELLDTGVHTVHHRLARRWRVGRVFLAGDAAHLLGALGTQGLDEGLRDADNLAWKLAPAWHHGPHEALLDSYQAERRAVVAARLRAADQALPLVRGGAGLRAVVPGSGRGHDSLLTDGHLGRGPLGAPGAYTDSPLRAPAHRGRGRRRHPARRANHRCPGHRRGRLLRTAAGPPRARRPAGRAGRTGHGRVGAQALGDRRGHAAPGSGGDGAAAPGRAAGRRELPGRRRPHGPARTARRTPGHRAERGAAGRSVRGCRGDPGRPGEDGGHGRLTVRPSVR
ncbi:FAD-dependent monooxygenase [Streptomyces sp. L7]